MVVNMTTRTAGIPEDDELAAVGLRQMRLILTHMNKRLAIAEYLAGEFTAADIFTGFSLTTMRVFYPLDLSPYPNIVRYLNTIGSREAYKRAMANGDPQLEPVLSGHPPENRVLP